jgi:hypothetical protein
MTRKQMGRIVCAVALVGCLAAYAAPTESLAADREVLGATFCSTDESCNGIRYSWAGCDFFPQCEDAYGWCEDRCGGQPDTYFCSYWGVNGELSNGYCNCSVCPPG